MNQLKLSSIHKLWSFSSLHHLKPLTSPLIFHQQQRKAISTILSTTKSFKSKHPLTSTSFHPRFSSSKFFPTQPTTSQRLRLILYNSPEIFVSIATLSVLALTSLGIFGLYQKGYIDSIRKYLQIETSPSSNPNNEKNDKVKVPIQVLIFLLGGVFSFLTSLAFRTKAHLNLGFLTFPDRVSFSLNILEGNSLKLRTIKEQSLESLMCGNVAATKIILKKIKKNTPNDPFITLPATENFFLQKMTFNQLSPLSAIGFFQMERGVPVNKTWYVVGLTFEKSAIFKKLRVIISSEDLLTKISKVDDSFIPELEDVAHLKRWKTLKVMSKIYLTDGVNSPTSCLWRIQLAFPN